MQKGGLGAFETPLKFPREESEANESCQRLSTVIASWEPQKLGGAQKKRRYNIGGFPPHGPQKWGPTTMSSCVQQQQKISQKCHKMFAQSFREWSLFSLQFSPLFLHLVCPCLFTFLPFLYTSFIWFLVGPKPN